MSSSQKIKRIYHTWEKWECYPAGFYENNKKNMSSEECIEQYKIFLSDIKRFEMALFKVITRWKNSCEHYLTNEKMNRIAWLGQASLCIETGIPSRFRQGYFKLSIEQRKEADEMALKWLNIWLNGNGYDSVNMIQAGVKAHANIY